MSQRSLKKVKCLLTDDIFMGSEFEPSCPRSRCCHDSVGNIKVAGLQPRVHEDTELLLFGCPDFNAHKVALSASISLNTHMHAHTCTDTPT